MQQVRVKSRLISSVAYNADTQTLHVWTNDKRHLTHTDISEAVYNNLVSAESAGFYYTYYIARKTAAGPGRRSSARTLSKIVAACAICMVLISISATSIAALS